MRLLAYACAGSTGRFTTVAPTEPAGANLVRARTRSCAHTRAGWTLVLCRLAFSVIVVVAEPLGGYDEGCFSCYRGVYFYKVPQQKRYPIIDRQEPPFPFRCV